MKKPVYENNIPRLLLTLCILSLASRTASAEIEKAGNMEFQMPPARIIEHRDEPPSRHHVWLDGYWNWVNDSWVWHKGKYVEAIQDRPPLKNQEFIPVPRSPDDIWVAGVWKLEQGDWSWHKGHYTRKPFRNDLASLVLL